MKLSELTKQNSFASLAQEAILNVMVTNSWLLGEISAALSEYGVTPSQYNVLRILRGSHPAALTCREIGERLIDRTPDVTRLLDRLERAEMIERERSEEDRRVVQVGISRKGLDLLRKMDGPIRDVQDRLTAHLTDAQLRKLCTLLEKLRTDQ